MTLQDQLEQNDRAHAIRVNRLQQQIAQADDQAETVNRMKHDELQLKVRSGSAICVHMPVDHETHVSTVSGGDGINARRLECRAREMSNVTTSQ